MQKKISTYWKCQLWGWGIFGAFSLIDITNGKETQEAIRDMIHTMIVGIFFSHLMRLCTRRLKLSEKPFWKLSLSTIFLTVLFGTCYGIAGHTIGEITGVWENNSTDQNTQFFIESMLFGVPFFAVWNIIYFVYKNQQRNKKRHEQEKNTLKIQAVELEAQALRAQMNPHFIFNSLNSIKSLIQQNENEKSVTYLTTFSKLIRTLLNNADKKEISLFDEMETCKLYLQLEAMRFDAKFNFAVNVDENIDLKSIQVPALIIQPFIENAIWHGIVPRNTSGKVSLNVLRKNGIIEVLIDDDGIGREASAQNKSASGLAHQSKGVNLTQTRLELNNLLQQRQAKLEIIDKKDENGVATGTKVIITIKEELS